MLLVFTSMSGAGAASNGVPKQDAAATKLDEDLASVTCFRNLQLTLGLQRGETKAGAGTCRHQAREMRPMMRL